MCETRFNLNDIILWKKRKQFKRKQKQHYSQQKQHNRKSTQHKICIYSSVAISVHCCWRWCSHLAGFHCSSLLGRLFISLAMAKKFFCGSCRHEVVHEVFVEGNCLSCRILHSRKLRSISESREPVSYSKDTQTPPDGNGDMHKFIRALLLRGRMRQSTRL